MAGSIRSVPLGTPERAAMTYPMRATAAVFSALPLPPHCAFVPDVISEEPMIILGIILLVLGFIFSIHILWIVGIIAVVVGVILAVAGFAGREVAGRRHWY